MAWRLRDPRLSDFSSPCELSLYFQAEPFMMLKMHSRFKRRFLCVAAAALPLCLPVGASADVLAVDVTIGMKIGLQPEETVTTSGVATVNEVAGGIHLVTLKLDPISPTR